MLLQSQGFKINEFQIPNFALNNGEMIRFWVQIIPRSENDTDGYWSAAKMQETIQELNSRDKSIKICPNRIKRNLIDYIKPKTISEYMRNRFGYSKNEIEKLISQFEIKPDYQIKNLGTGHQKVFSILCEFQRNRIVLFDYYGLSPHTEEQLTKFVKNELSKGKSVISFDNLYYKPEIPDSEQIFNLEIRRKRKLN